MLEILEKNRLIISLGLFIILIGCSVFWPASTQVVGVTLLALVLGTTVFMQVRKHHQAFYRAEITEFTLKRNIAIDIIVIILVFLLTNFLGRWIGTYSGLFIVKRIETVRPETVMAVGFLAVMIAAFIVGFLVWQLADWMRNKLGVR